MIPYNMSKTVSIFRHSSSENSSSNFWTKSRLGLILNILWGMSSSAKGRVLYLIDKGVHDLTYD